MKPRAYGYMVLSWVLIGLCIYTRHEFAFALMFIFIFVVGAIDYEAMGLGGPFGIKRPGPEKPWQD